MSYFYFDIVCPYAYMAFSYLKSEGVFARKQLSLKPILLGGLFKQLQQPLDPNQVMHENKASYIRKDILRQAQFFNIPLDFHPEHPVSSLNSMRLITLCQDPNLQLKLVEALYKAYWQKNLDLSDEKVLEPLAKEFGLDLALIEAKETKEALKKATNEAFLNKIFGVPTVALNNRTYFGADRLVFLQDELKLKWPKQNWHNTTEKIDFYFDFSSPYSYLGFAEASKNPNKFNFKPVLLGAIFQSLGTTQIPMLSAHPHKTAYYMQDMQDWAKARALNFTFNDNFPLRSVNACRAFLVEPKCGHTIFEAAWAKNLNIGDEEVLLKVLNESGFDGANILSQTKTQNIKDLLRDNTEEAIERGVFGVPSFFVNGELYFGQDRF